MKTFLPILSLLLFCALLSGCYTPRLDPADVATERLQYQAIAAVTADDTIDALEKPALATNLAAWNAKITGDEALVVGKQKHSMLDLMLVLANTYFEAAVGQVFAPELQRRAPVLFAAVDLNRDGLLSSDELHGIDPADPGVAGAVIVTIVEILKHKT